MNIIKLEENMDILKDILINDYLYSEINISTKKIFNTLPFTTDLTVFKENLPHTIENLIIACDTSSKTIESCLDQMNQLSSYVYNDFHIIYYNNEYMKIMKYYKEKDEIKEHFVIPSSDSEPLIPYKKDLIFTDELLRIIEIIHNHIYANEGYSTNEVFDELIKILMIKFVDEKKDNNDKLDFYITEEESELIQKDKGNMFTNRINKLYEEVIMTYSNIFNKNDTLKLSSKVLAFTVSQLQRYNLFSMDNDIKGLIFQKVIGRGQKGERGQFFTPDPIVDFMVNFLKPKSNELVMDPACGTGGFLRQVISYTRKNSSEDYNMKDYINNNIFGIEINPNIARVANLRFIFEGSSASNVICCNALNEFDELKNCNKKNNDYSDKIIEKESVDIILTNPPFGSQGKISDKTLLSNFDLGYRWDKKGKTNKILNGQVPDILFIERSINLLKENGKMGIILPDGDLENQSLQYIRDYIKDKCNVLAVIKLPEQAFIPFGTGVKTSILFLQKKAKDVIDIQNNKVFFARIDKLGYSYNKTSNIEYKKNDGGNLILDEYNNPIIEEDYTDVINSYERYKSTGELIEDDKCFLIDSSKLNERFDFEFYQPKYMDNINILKKQNAVPLNSIANILRGKDNILKEKNRIVEYVEISDVNQDYSEILSSTKMLVHQLPSRASFKINTGDIITSVSGNAIGTPKHASALVNETFDNAICTNGFRVIKPFAIDPYYLLYFLRSDYFLNQILRLRTGAAIPSLYDKDFNNVLVLLPDEKIIESISKKVKLSYKLREEAKEILNEDFNIIS